LPLGIGSATLNHLPRYGLAQAVQRALRQAGLIAPLAHPIAEPGVGERLAEDGRDKEPDRRRGQRIDRGARGREHGDARLVAALCVRDVDSAAADMVALDLVYVAAPARGVEGELQRQPRHGAERMRGAVLLDL